MRSVYSNGVKPSHLSLVKQHAVSKLEFTKVASKTTASVHIKNKDLNTSLVIAFNRSGCVSQWIPCLNVLFRPPHIMLYVLLFAINGK